MEINNGGDDYHDDYQPYYAYGNHLCPPRVDERLNLDYTPCEASKEERGKKREDNVLAFHIVEQVTGERKPKQEATKKSWCWQAA